MAQIRTAIRKRDKLAIPRDYLFFLGGLITILFGKSACEHCRAVSKNRPFCNNSIGEKLLLLLLLRFILSPKFAIRSAV